MNDLPIVLNTPSLTVISLEDISYALHNICRYHGSIPVTVAQHTILCVWIAKEILPYYSTLDRGIVLKQVAAHDFSEAYYGDIPRGLRLALGDALTAITLPWDKWVHKWLDIPFPEGEYRVFVDFVDQLAAYAEMEWFQHAGKKDDLFSSIAIRCGLRLFPNRKNMEDRTKMEELFEKEVLSIVRQK
jgi:hypothetical protein